MKADGIWANIFRFGSRNQPLSEILHNIPLFQGLTPKELRILEHAVHVRTYQPEESVFSEGEPGAGMYVIRSGRVDILLKQENFSVRWRCLATRQDPQQRSPVNNPNSSGFFSQTCWKSSTFIL